MRTSSSRYWDKVQPPALLRVVDRVRQAAHPRHLERAQTPQPLPHQQVRKKKPTPQKGPPKRRPRPRLRRQPRTRALLSPRQVAKPGQKAAAVSKRGGGRLVKERLRVAQHGAMQ